MRFKLSNFVLASGVLLVAGVLAGCNEQGTTTVPGAVPAPAPVEIAPVVRASVPAGAQFAVSQDTPESIKGMTESAACSLENVINVADNSPSPGEVPNSYKVGKSKAYKLIGFATNKDVGTVPESIRLMLVGTQVYGIDSVTGWERPDVATFFKMPALSNAGYQADAAFDDVAPGEYGVFVIETDGPAPVVCPTHQTITIQ